MNFRTTYILFAVLFAFLGVMLLSQLFGTRSKQQDEFVLSSVHDIVKPVKADDIETVEIQRFRPTKETLRFYKDSKGVWRCKDPNVRLVTGIVRQLIDQVMSARKDEQADLTSDLKKFGLDSPAAKITLIKSGGEREWWVDIGDQSPGGVSSNVYVTSSDDPKTPVAVHRSDLESAFKTLTDFRAKDLLADNSFDIADVKIQAGSKSPVNLEKSSDGKWRFKQPAFGDAETDAEPPTNPGAPTPPGRIAAVNELLSAITALRVNSDADFDTTDAKDAELVQKGLTRANPALLRLEVTKQPSQALTDEKKAPTTDALLIGKKVENKDAKDPKDEKYYARLESEPNIVKIPADKVAGLLKVAEDPSPLRNRDLVQADSSRIDAIDVQPTGREMLEFRKGASAQWKLYEGGKPLDVDMVSVLGLVNSVTAKRLVKDFPDTAKTDAELGFDKPTAVISLWTDGVKKEETPGEDAKKEDEKDGSKKGEAKKDGDKKDAAKDDKKPASQMPQLKDPKPTVKLTFGKRDKDLVFVKREIGSEVARMAVPGTVLDRASEGKLAYFDKRFPATSFGADAIKVVLTRDGTIFEMSRAAEDKEKAPWKLALPKDLAGRSVENSKLQRILSTFSHLVASKLVADKVNDNDLERFGLKNPSTKLAITTEKDKKTEENVYLLGKETDDKEGVYAKIANRDLVFVLPNSMVDSLKGDLQDPVVLQFDPAKVKAMKVSGWSDIVGSTFTLQLERKSATEWIAKAPADYRIDPGAAESFVSGLNGLRAVSFVGSKTGPKPEQKFDLKEGELEIVLTLDGEAQPITVQVGAKTAEGWFTMCSKLPGEVFVTPLDRFEKIKTKPAFFKKD
jgi:Domain of unknown function (DUF4340)